MNELIKKKEANRTFSGVLSASSKKTVQVCSQGGCFPEHCRPVWEDKESIFNSFRSIVGHSFSKSSIFVFSRRKNVKSKNIWLEQQ